MRANAKRPIAAAIAALALAVLVAACEDDSNDAVPIGVQTTSAGPGATTAAPSSTTPSNPSSGADSPSTPSVADTTAAPSTPSSAVSVPADVTSVDGVTVSLTEIAALDEPIALGLRTSDDGMYIAERVGRLRVVRDGVLAAEPVLDFSDAVTAGGEQGFLGFAFSPAGDRLYVNYTGLDANDRLDEYAVAADGTINRDSRRELIVQEDFAGNHNGGQVLFGPDGYLYTGFGDGGGANDPQRTAQDLGTLLGKILRIDPTPSADQPYTSPPDNPFVGQDEARPEIWSYGLRNPWRFTFDAANGDLWVGDVGQNAIEEVDWVAAPAAGRGVNFGWSEFEGTRPANDDQDSPGHVPPVFEYDHNSGDCSVTGGYRYRGTAIPELYGAYVFADYCQGGIRAVAFDGGQVSDVVEISSDVGEIVSFGEDADHELYVLSFDGTVRLLGPS